MLGKHRKIDPQALAIDIQKCPDGYQYERAKRFQVCQKSIWHALGKLGVTYKKTQKHPKVNEDIRRVFREKIKCHTQSGKPLVYIDESGFAHDMPRTHGYALKGQKCYGSHDWNAKGRTNALEPCRGQPY